MASVLIENNGKKKRNIYKDKEKEEKKEEKKEKRAQRGTSRDGPKKMFFLHQKC